MVRGVKERCNQRNRGGDRSAWATHKNVYGLPQQRRAVHPLAETGHSSESKYLTIGCLRIF